MPDHADTAPVSTSSAVEERGFVRKDLPSPGAGSPSRISQKKKSNGTRKITATADDDVAELSAARDLHIEEQLAQIYGNGDGTMPDMRRFEKKNRRTVFTAAATLVVACVFLGGVAWAGFFFFQPQAAFTEKDVILSISGDEQVTIGAPVSYRIRYRNDQSVPLSQVVLQIRYPDGFVFATSSRDPTNDGNDEWALGAVDPYDSGYIDVQGYFYSDIGNKESLRAFLNYKPANFSSEFQKVATVNAEMTASPVRLVVDGGAEVAAGADTTFTVVVTGEQTLASSSWPLTVVLDPGSIFHKKTSEPASDQYGNYRWTLPSAVGERRVVVQGAFAAEDASTTAPISIVAIAKKPGERRGNGFVVARAEYAPRVVRSDVSARLVINGGLGDATVAPGETLHAGVVVQNTGATPIKKVRIRAFFDSPSYKKKTILDWGKLADERNGAVIGEQLNDMTRRGAISWGSGEIMDLRQLDPGEQVMIDWQLPLKGTGDEELPLYPPQDILASVDVQYESGGGKQILSGNTIRLSLVSDTAFKVDDTVQTGADGKETHAVTWLLNNSFHPLKDIHLEADLYGDIAWNDSALKVPAGIARYDAGNKKVIWDIPEMPTSVDTFALQFAVVLNTKNPTQTQLSSKVKGSATDAVTGKEILLVGDEILLPKSDTGN